MDKAWIEFKKKIETALQTEMGQCTVDKGIPGCKISNAHVRLTSGLHLRDFFHAELLLQNGSILKGFAKQLVKYIEANRRKEENIFLIGCEGYSELLIQEVAFELKPVLKSEAEVQYAIFADNAFRKQNAISGFGDNRMMYSPALYSKARAERVNFIKNASVFVVSPISTTFSSYLNLLDHLQQEVERADNLKIYLLALIVVDANTKSKKVRKSFWRRRLRAGIWNRVKLLPRSSKEHRKTVDYLIKTETSWYFPDSCQLCGSLSEKTNKKKTPQETPLMCVDSSSSAPSQIFISGKACYSAASNIAAGTKKENDERVKQMKGCITYGHVTRGKNHYQFFIDAEKYYDKCADEIQSWLNQIGKTIHALDAQEPDICIVLTPFKEETIPFVHDICKILFSGKQIFILQLDSRDLYRENIRTKYRNIISTIEGKNPKTIGVYFIDQIIVNGGSFRRLWGMAQTLLAEADCPKQEVDGIFTLINRNSKDKIREMISSPEHYYAFVHLAIPNFRMDSTGCPICALQRQYQLMEKRSATNWLAKRYRGLENKHMLRSLEEYQAAEKAEMLGRHGYYKWMKQWVYHHLKVDNNEEVFQSIEEKQRLAFNKLTKFPPDESTKADAFCDSYEAWTQQIRGICIESFSKEKERKEEQIALLREAIDERNYMRLWCTHRAYSELDQKRPVTKADAIDLILQLICDEIRKVSGPYCKDKRAEWLISYVKVLSRDLLGKYWIVKSAMFDIMKALIEAMLVEPKNRERYWGQLDTGDAETTKRLKQLLKGVVFPDLRDKPNRTRALSAQVQYQLMVTLVKRLSAMQSTYLLQEETILKLILGFARIQSKHYCYPDYDTDELCGTCAKTRYFHLNEVPNNKKFAERLLQFVKWTSMSGKDESKDFLTEKTIEKLLEGEKLHGKASGLNTATIYDVIWAFYVENNSVIYSGIERWAKTVENVPEKEWPGEVGVQLENVEKDRRNNALFSMLNFMEQATDYANPKKGKQSVLEQQIIAMLTLFVKLDNLEKRVKADNTLDNDKLPYELEEVCNAMNEIMDCVESWIVYRQGNQTKQLAASSIAIDAFDTAWKMSEILELIRAKSKTADEKEYSWWDGDVYCVKKGDSQIHVRVRLEIPRDQAREKPIEIFLLFRDCDIQLDKSDQDKNKSDKGENNKYIELFYRLRNILFLRSTLVTVLQRKLFTLMHCYDEYDYISRLDDSDRIMHISDLHATKKMEENIKFYLQSNMPGKNDDNPLKANLLVITGDVAQGAPNASAFWANYRAAEQIIKEIAKWCFCSDRAGKQVVKHDWRKRIVIIPGNHDYVSTSDLSTTINANRSTGTSQVIDTENGSTMSKFGYYIDFIRELLDININDLIENGLTEVRNYTNLKTRIISLNSCAKANALKTNKVGVNPIFIDRLESALNQDAERGETELNTIILVHHGPNCKIDYVHDTYQHPYLLECEIKEFLECNGKAILKCKAETLLTCGMQTFLKCAMEAFLEQKAKRESLKDAINEIEALGESNQKKLIKLYLANDSIEREEPVTLREAERERYFAAIQREREKTQAVKYIRASENADQSNDYYMKLRYEMEKDKEVSQKDEAEFQTQCERIERAVDKYCVYLSGHTHITRSDKVTGARTYEWHEIACTYEKKYEEDRSCFIPSCTWKFKQKEYFNYGMLTFNESGVCYTAYKGIGEPFS